jgi:hypothetical protein
MKQGRLEREISDHLYAINELLLSATTSELSTFDSRLDHLSATNCGWILYRVRLVLMDLMSNARQKRRKHGIYKEMPR